MSDLEKELMELKAETNAIRKALVDSSYEINAENIRLKSKNVKLIAQIKEAETLLRHSVYCTGTPCVCGVDNYFNKYTQEYE